MSIALKARYKTTVKKAIEYPEASELAQKYREASQQVNSIRARLRREAIESARKNHFRYNDTRELEAQFDPQFEPPARQATTAPESSLPERRNLTKLLTFIPEDQDAHLSLERRKATVINLAGLCRRVEMRPISRLPDHVQSNDLDRSEGSPHNPLITRSSDILFSLHISHRQCRFCLVDARLPEEKRCRIFHRKWGVWDHVESLHAKYIDAASDNGCPHPICREEGVIINDEEDLLNHLERSHKWDLRSRK